MKPYEMRLGVQREVENFELNPFMVEVFLGTTWAPNFFAWVVPTSNTSARIGLAIPLKSSKAGLTYLNNFMESHPLVQERVKGSRCIHQSVHIIPTGGPPDQTVSAGKLLVGDAAGQIKSTTGGGLFIGMSCAIIAGKVIAKALSEGDGVLQTSQLTRYDEEWRTKFGQEIEFSVPMRRFLDSLTDDEVDYLFKIVTQNEALLKTIEAKGDIDRQSTVSLLSLRHIKSIVKKPRLLYKLTRLLTRFALRAS
jgi:flavin-dependent dehydrogenase